MLITELGKGLDNIRVGYIIIGGQAVLIYGEPRLTKDIDITIGVNPKQKNKIINLAETLKLNILVNNCEKFIDDTYVLPCESKKYSMRVDFIFSDTEYEKLAIKRANKILIQDYGINFASLEDLVIHKIIAGRARDIEDIEIILMKNKNYDINYIIKWLNSFEKALSVDLITKFNEILEIIQ